MSLPEPINWLHMSDAQYIYLVSTGPPELDSATGDYWQNFPEPSSRSVTTVDKQRFWNFNNWEFFTNEQKAIKRAEEICWPNDLVTQTKIKGFADNNVGQRKKLSIKDPYPTTGVEIIHKWGFQNRTSKKYCRQTYVVRVKTNVPKTEGFRNWSLDSGPNTHLNE